MVSKPRISDILLALFVVAIAALLLVPLPTLLLDLLLSLNLCFSLLLLLSGLFTPNALALLAFPSLLLLTTLFRLGLNVASTRLILSQGYAGRVIETFGTFLIRGEIIVGIIIFLIITIVYYIVIARGASRVSEVAARFALDSMPGKQMSIDADLRAGNISREEAEQRREDLRKESQLYGSMDGAMKFVQGDAIAGFFIILTNIVGGLYLGVSQGMPFADAITRYTVLTVGDGLVSQVPALLTSICAGIVVTRVSSGGNTTLGSDVGAQLFNKPGSVVFAGVILILFGLVPGLPHFAFILVGSVFVLSAWLMRRSQMRSGLLALPAGSVMTSGQNLPALPESDRDGHSQLELRLDAAVLHRLFTSATHSYLSWWQQMQLDFQAETGLQLPGLKVTADDTLNGGSYVVRINAVPVFNGQVLLDALLLEVSPESAESFGLKILKEERHPLSGEKLCWGPASRGLQEICRAADIQTFDGLQFVMLRAALFFRQNPEELLSLSQVHAWLKALEKRSPGFLEEVVNRNFVSTSRLTEILCELVREDVSIRDFRQIVEQVAAYCSQYGLRPEEPENFNFFDLISYIRQGRRRQILARAQTQRGSVKVCRVSDEVSGIFGDAEISSISDNMAFAPDLRETLQAGLRSLIEPVKSRGIGPLVLLCRREIMFKVLSFLRSSDLSMQVAGLEEFGPEARLETLGVWSLTHPI